MSKRRILNSDEVFRSDEQIPRGSAQSAMTIMKSKFFGLIDYVREDRYVQILLAILLFGIVLRYYGLRNAESTDEYNEVFEALRVASGKFNTNRWHKKGFQNILAVEYGIYFVV